MISTPTQDGDKSPQELFSGVNISPKIKHFHTFTCSTYILDNALQGQQVSIWGHPLTIQEQSILY